MIEEVILQILGFLGLLSLPVIYYLACYYELKNKHPIKKLIWCVVVPLCIILIPITVGISLLPLVFFIILGEAFDFDVKKENENDNCGSSI